MIATALIVKLWIGAFLGFLDEACRQHLLDGSVEGGRSQVKRTVGVGLDFAHDAVAVPFLARQRQKNMERGRRDWQLALPDPAG